MYVWYLKQTSWIVNNNSWRFELNVYFFIHLGIAIISATSSSKQSKLSSSDAYRYLKG